MAVAAGSPQIPSAAGVYTACLASDGTIRLIDPTIKSCTAAQKAVTWNQKGQPGPAGPTGLNGPTGVAGPTGATGQTGPAGPGTTTSWYNLTTGQTAFRGTYTGFTVTVLCDNSDTVTLGISSTDASRKFYVFERADVFTAGQAATVQMSAQDIEGNQAAGWGMNPTLVGRMTLTIWNEGVASNRAFVFTVVANTCGEVAVTAPSS
jgi:hypothetical protein